jgi:hypothetical protein
VIEEEVDEIAKEKAAFKNNASSPIAPVVVKFKSREVPPHVDRKGSNLVL